MRVELPAWPTTEAAAVAMQDALRGQVRQVDAAHEDARAREVDREQGGLGDAAVRLVAGVDVAYDADSDLVAGAVSVLDASSLDLIEEATVVSVASFPYVPGLLAFREIPILVAALEKLTHQPDLLVCDGYGLAHPRRFGLASHLGVLTGLPSIGVAKTPFVGASDDLLDRLKPQRGATVDLVDGGEVVGRALRTQDGVKPIYVSVGHLVDLDTACQRTLDLARKYRQPESTRRADAASRLALKEAVQARGVSPERR